jgi:hypothetical protein
MLRLRSLLILAAVVSSVSLPISYAVIDDAATAEQRQARASLKQALRHPDRYVVEGVAWVTMVGPEGKSMTTRLKIGWTRDKKPFEILSVERDGKRIPIPPKFSPPAPARWMSQLVRDFDLLDKNYRILPAGDENVAGRPCLRMTLASRHPDRPRHRLWIDREKNILLKREVVGMSGKRRMDAGFEEVSIRERERERQPRPKDKLKPPVVGGPISGFTVEASDERSALGFAPIERVRLANGFERKRFRIVKLQLQWPVPRTLASSVAVYSDGIEGLVVMQILTRDLKTLEEIAKAHKDPQIWQAMSQSGFPRELIRRGSSARVEIGDTTLLAAGSVGQNEIKILVSKFLTN